MDVEEEDDNEDEKVKDCDEGIEGGRRIEEVKGLGNRGGIAEDKGASRRDEGPRRGETRGE